MSLKEAYNKALEMLKEKDMSPGQYVHNKKTHGNYAVMNIYFNTTNKDDGQVMVAYTSFTQQFIFVRDLEEFLIKFEAGVYSE